MDTDHHVLSNAIISLEHAIRDESRDFRHAMERMSYCIETQNELKQIRINTEKIMATQTEIAQQLRNSVITLNKIGTETDKLIQKVADLTAAVANQDNASDELTAAVKAVEDQLKSVDDKVPDEAQVPSVGTPA